MRRSLNGIRKLLAVSIALTAVILSGCDIRITIDQSGSSSSVPAGFDNSSKKIEAVFSGIEEQPYTDEAGEKEMLDTVWIYYNDGSFDQYAVIDDNMIPFSLGSYSLLNGEDFVYGSEQGHVDITIDRSRKVTEGNKIPSPYESSHTYDLPTLDFDKIYPLTANAPKIAAVFYGVDKQPYTGSDKDEENLDTIWIYYEDGSFDQFVSLNDETVLFSEGFYELSNGADFVYESAENDHGQITINRNKKYQSDGSLGDYESSHTYDLASLGFTKLYPCGE